MLVRNHGKHVYQFPVKVKGGNGQVKTVALVPGTNDVDDEDWKAITEHTLYEVLLKEEQLEELEGGIEKLKVPQALDVIRDTADVKTLERMYEKDSRRTVREAIEKQIERLTVPTPTGEEEEVV